MVFVEQIVVPWASRFIAAELYIKVMGIETYDIKIYLNSDKINGIYVKIYCKFLLISLEIFYRYPRYTFILINLSIKFLV